MSKILKAFICFILSILLLFFLTACTDNSYPSLNNVPITYTDFFGYTSTINSTPPERIISLSPNTTEILYFLGLENKIVGRTDYCDFPSSISSVQSIGNITEPNTELIVSLNPDLIITDGMQSEDFITNLRNLGLTVIIVRSNESLDGTYSIISDIGRITNTSPKAENIVNNMKDTFSKIDNIVKSIEKKKTVYYSISLSESGLYTSGANTYINELLSKAGLINIAIDMDGWTYSLEKLIEHDPDIILCSNLYDAESEILNFNGIKDLTAIKSKNVIKIDDNLISRQTPRNVEGIKLLLEEVYNLKID